MDSAAQISTSNLPVQPPPDRNSLPWLLMRKGWGVSEETYTEKFTPEDRYKFYLQECQTKNQVELSRSDFEAYRRENPIEIDRAVYWRSDSGTYVRKFASREEMERWERSRGWKEEN